MWMARSFFCRCSCLNRLLCLVLFLFSVVPCSSCVAKLSCSFSLFIFIHQQAALNCEKIFSQLGRCRLAFVTSFFDNYCMDIRHKYALRFSVLLVARAGCGPSPLKAWHFFSCACARMPRAPCVCIKQ